MGKTKWPPAQAAGFGNLTPGAGQVRKQWWTNVYNLKVMVRAAARQKLVANFKTGGNFFGLDLPGSRQGFVSIHTLNLARRRRRSG
jgi:hypothetical protein